MSMTTHEVPAPANSELRSEIKRAINRASAENGSDTPDHILADYLLGCLACEWSGQNYMHAAHVSERVMAMLTEEWGLVERRAVRPEWVEDVPRREVSGGRIVTDGPIYAHHIVWHDRVCLVTDWTDDTDEGDDQ